MFTLADRWIGLQWPVCLSRRILKEDARARPRRGGYVWRPGAVVSAPVDGTPRNLSVESLRIPHHLPSDDRGRRPSRYPCRPQPHPQDR
uniref:Uncharacterized protein n=1 Tax=uncultured marine group II/III euryarchaeote AD1000_105_G07 TaxID=1457714 RepID=A0A075FI17_9EURY|nr:hypothetical protein [uncultured marine group II/III euryarchaeote AD1000_105_G07]